MTQPTGTDILKSNLPRRTVNKNPSCPSFLSLLLSSKNIHFQFSYHILQPSTNLRSLLNTTYIPLKYPSSFNSATRNGYRQVSAHPLHTVEPLLLTACDRNAVNQGLETLQQGGAGAQKEANKRMLSNSLFTSPTSSSRTTANNKETEVAKDSNAPIGDRATAAKDAVGHKFDETKHDVR